MSRSVDILINAKNNTAGAFGAARGQLTGLKNSVLSLKGALIGLTAGLSLRVLVNELQETSEAIDSVAKVSDKLGIATEELIGLQHAAGLAGADAETLNKGLEKMNVNIGKAASDGGAAAETFTRLGLSVGKLSGLTTDEKFRQLSDAINALPTASDRAAAAMEVFGRSGLTLLPTIAAGSVGLKEMTAEALKLHIAYSRVDAAKVEAANDALTRMGGVWTGIKNTLAIELAPVVEAIAKNFTDMATEGKGLKAWIPTIEGITSGLSGVLDIAHAIRLAFSWTRVNLTEMLTDLSQLKPGNILDKLVPGLSSARKLLGAPGVQSTLGEEMSREAAKLRREHNKLVMSVTPGEQLKRAAAKIQQEAQKNAIAVAKAAEEKQKVETLGSVKTQLKEFFGSFVNQTDKKGKDQSPLAFFQNSAKLAADAMGGAFGTVADDFVKRSTKRFDALRKSAADIKEDNRTRQEILQEGLAKAQKLRDLKLIDDETLKRQQKKLHAEFRPDQKFDDAASSNRFLTRVSPAGDPAIAIKKSSEHMVKQNNETNKLLREATELLRNNRILFKQLGR